MYHTAFTFLLDLYHFIWRTGDFPSSRGVAVVLPIQKPWKDHIQPTNSRAISLTFCGCKVLEKMGNDGLEW